MDIAISFAQLKGQHRDENLEFVQRDVGQAHLLWMEFCGQSARHQKAGAMAIFAEGQSKEPDVIPRRMNEKRRFPTSRRPTLRPLSDAPQERSIHFHPRH